MIKYCGSACQKKHRRTHKVECKKRVSELHDEILFAEPPKRNECPICFLPLPIPEEETAYMSCCGKSICGGCCDASDLERYSSAGPTQPDKCPFCRAAVPNLDEGFILQLERRAHESNDARAFHILGTHYFRGDKGLKQDRKVAIELWIRAAELGSVQAQGQIASVYTPEFSLEKVDGVEKDMKTAMHYWELAAIGGNLMARHNLGCFDLDAKNYRRGMKHFMISARAGFDKSLNMVKDGFKNGDVTKEEFAKTLRAHKESVDEMKSIQRTMFLMKTKADFDFSSHFDMMTDKEKKEFISSPEFIKIRALMKKHNINRRI